MGVLVLRSSIVAAPPESNISPSLTANRTSGPAPLAIRFDASGTTATGVTQPFRDLGYSFNYGDSGSGTFENGDSKNVDRGGPFGAHVFETPGTYTVKVGVLNPDDSDFAQTSITITVQDPDTVYSGTNTICYSLTSDHTGAPAGAQLVSNATALPAIESNKRYLFHRGQDFSSLPGSISWNTGVISVGYGVTDAQIGDYGTGDPPIFNKAITWVDWQGAASAPERITFYNLECVSDSDTIGGFSHRNCSWLWCGFGTTLNHIGEGIRAEAEGSNGTSEQRAALYFPEYTIYHECYPSVPATDSCLFGTGYGWVIQGTSVTNPYQHCIRTYAAPGALIQHNVLNASTHSGGGTNIGHNIKMQGIGPDIVTPGESALSHIDPATSYAIIRENDIGVGTDTNFDWTPIIVGPENPDTPVQGLEWVIIEANRLAGNYAFGIQADGRFHTVRGNTGSTPQMTETDIYAPGLPGGINGAWDGAMGLSPRSSASSGINGSSNRLEVSQIATQDPV